MLVRGTTFKNGILFVRFNFVCAFCLEWLFAPSEDELLIAETYSLGVGNPANLPVDCSESVYSLRIEDCRAIG